MLMYFIFLFTYLINYNIIQLLTNYGNKLNFYLFVSISAKLYVDFIAVVLYSMIILFKLLNKLYILFYSVLSSVLWIDHYYFLNDLINYL
jgi:hypothetical protein